MLKNRTISVDLVKKGTTNTDDQSGIGFEEKAKIIGGLIEDSAIKIGIGVCAYVLLDTVRKVAVVSVSH